MIQLIIPDTGELRLDFCEAKKFSMCKLSYKDKRHELDMCQDYLYIFIENMLGRIRKIPILEQEDLFGEMGRWQEYYYYDSSYCELHAAERSLMEKSLFISTEGYGTFLYKFNGNVWLEINKGYGEESGLLPTEFYKDSANYRILLAVVPEKTLKEWENLLSSSNI